jgi:EF-hand domain pair
MCCALVSHLILSRQDAFDRLDRDSSGFIEAREVKLLLDDVYEGNAPSFEVDALLKFFDKNKDGKISFAEFETGLGAAMTEKAKPNKLLSLMLDSHDDDDDPVSVEPEVSGTFLNELVSPFEDFLDSHNTCFRGA